MRASPLGRFVLWVAAWLPLTFAAWYLAAPLLVWPVGVLAELFMKGAFGDLIRGVEQSGALLTFMTSLKPAQGATDGSVTAVVSAESNVLLFSFGFPMLAALILAVRERHPLRRMLLGYVVLLPFQTWGVVADVLKNVVILAPPAISAQTGFNAWQREVIIFAYQFGSLILPTVAPAIVWVLMHRRFLENFANRDTATKEEPALKNQGSRKASRGQQADSVVRQ